MELERVVEAVRHLLDDARVRTRPGLERPSDHAVVGRRRQRVVGGRRLGMLARRVAVLVAVGALRAAAERLTGELALGLGSLVLSEADVLVGLEAGRQGGRVTGHASESSRCAGVRCTTGGAAAAAPRPRFQAAGCSLYNRAAAVCRRRRSAMIVT